MLWLSAACCLHHLGLLVLPLPNYFKSCSFRVLEFFSFVVSVIWDCGGMEEYNNQLNENSAPRGNFLYASPVLAVNSSGYGRTSSGSNVGNQQTQMPINSFPLQSGGECFQSEAHPIVKTEASTSQHVQKFHYPLMRVQQQQQQQHQHQHQQHGNESSGEVEDIKAKIMAHPQYSNLLEAYMDCQKVYIFTFHKLYIRTLNLDEYKETQEVGPSVPHEASGLKV